MILSIEEVEHMARLARLELTPAEKTLFQSQLSAILEFAARLQSVDTRDVPANSSALAPEEGLRDDRARLGLSTEDLLGNAPQVEERQFRLPPVFE